MANPQSYLELFGKISQDVREIGKVFAAGLEGAEVAAEVALGRVVAGVPEAETSESVGWQNFGKLLLVFGCIGTDLCKKICVLQHFSKSIRLSC